MINLLYLFAGVLIARLLNPAQPPVFVQAEAQKAKPPKPGKPRIDKPWAVASLRAHGFHVQAHKQPDGRIRLTMTPISPPLLTGTELGNG